VDRGGADGEEAALLLPRARGNDGVAAARVVEWSGSSTGRAREGPKERRGAAARTLEVGKDRHGENEGLGFWRPGLWTAK
jgi:hypothetical protein